MTFIVIRNRDTGEVSIHSFDREAEALAFKTGALAYARAANVDLGRLGVHHFFADNITNARATWPRYFPAHEEAQ